MLKLEASIALGLIVWSTPLFAREPGPERPEHVASLEGEQPRTLHFRPLASNVPDALPPAPPPPSATQAASDGLLSPFASPALILTSRASAQSYAGYDSAVSLARVRASAEGRLASFLSVRVEFEHGPTTGADDRVSVGARLGILTQQKYGLDLGAGLFYEPKDFRGEGNIVSGLMVARHFRRLGVFASGLFGSDPEGDDQLLELRLGSLYAANEWLSIGVDGRSRSSFSQDQKRTQARSIDWELQAGPTAIFCLGQVSLMALVGPSIIRETPAGGESSRDPRTHGGLLAMAGAGSAF
jgi:hypothetical protein